MKISRAWLQDYIAEPLPDAAAIHDALTFHSCEVEEVLTDGADGGDVVMDVKVLADRASYALSHRGMASELAAALGKSLTNDPLQEASFDASSFPNDGLGLVIDDAASCKRYCAVRMDGVSVGPSPEWLKTRLEAVGQRSINNVVDATNYVMLALGQPLHAFDAIKLGNEKGDVSIRVRGSEAGEKITALGGAEYSLPVGTQLITNATTDEPLAIAGIKGGSVAEVDAHTTSIVLEAACFDASTTRRTAQALKLFTDASVRFQNNLSPELVGHGMREVVALVEKTAGGRVAAAIDCYPTPAPPATAFTAKLSDIAAILGTPITAEDATEALTRLQLTHTISDDDVTITPPFWRNDLTMTADLAEEIGRILGYDRVPAVPLQVSQFTYSHTASAATFAGIERIRDVLVGRGFTEISTPSFADAGEIRLSNPLQSDKPFLRSTLSENMSEALKRAKDHAPLALGPAKRVLLFELGTVFAKDGEHFSLALGYEPLTEKKNTTLLEDVAQELRKIEGITIAVHGNNDNTIVEIPLTTFVDTNGGELTKQRLGMFAPFSSYPFAIRDVAVWVLTGTQEAEVANAIRNAAGSLVVRMDCFDRFEKEERTSYAFRLIFQSFERTLTEDDLEPAMTAVYNAIAAKDGWEAR